ncbi:hypothetical protein SANTM175S_01635 [Streptomyces antimycoticus]
MPPMDPFGVPNSGSISSWWNSLGGCPSRLTISGAKIATRTRKTTTMPPASASLSRFRRVQAICRSDLPSTDALTTSAATSAVATGSLSVLVPCNGAVIVVETPLDRW